MPTGRLIPTLYIGVDTSEQKRVVFPPAISWYDVWGTCHLSRVVTLKVNLFTGDYAPVNSKGDLLCQGKKALTLVERKGRLDELTTNFCTADWRRFKECLDRMAVETELPYLLLDMAVPAVSTQRTHYTRNVWDVVDRLYREAARRRIGLLWLPPPSQRGSQETSRPNRTGTHLAHLFIQIIYNQQLRRTP